VYSPHVRREEKVYVPTSKTHQPSPTNFDPNYRTNERITAKANPFKAKHLEDKFAQSRKMLDDIRLGKYTVEDPIK
jgi:hypothetical protein